MSRGRKRVLIVAATVLVVAAGVAVLWRPTTPPDLPSRVLNVEKFGEVKNGMTRAEVEQLLGGPPGYYGRIPTRERMSTSTMEGHLTPPFASKHEWYNDNNRFEIYFDQLDRVVAAYKRKGFRVMRSDGPGFFRRLLRSLDL